MQGDTKAKTLALRSITITQHITHYILHITHYHSKSRTH